MIAYIATVTRSANIQMVTSHFVGKVRIFWNLAGFYSKRVCSEQETQTVSAAYTSQSATCREDGDGGEVISWSRPEHFVTSEYPPETCASAREHPQEPRVTTEKGSDDSQINNYVVAQVAMPMYVIEKEAVAGETKIVENVNVETKSKHKVKQLSVSFFVCMCVPRLL